MNKAKGDPVDPGAFMPLADGPLAPPAGRGRKQDAPADGLRGFLGGKAKKAAKKRARG